MKPDGSDQKRLTNNSANDEYPSWSPDRSQIVFASDRRGGPYELYKMKADGSDVVRLTNNTQDLTPSWSPDGTQIAFMSYRNAGKGGDLYLMRADGGGVTRLTSSTDNDSYPTWHPSGKRIVFLREGPPPDYKKFVCERDLVTGKTRQIIGCGQSGGRPEYSPDGGKIVFAADRWGKRRDLCTVNPDGTGLQRLTSTGADDDHPSWSPDGSKIVFTSDRSGRFQIWRRHETGTYTRVATNNAQEHSPEWSF